MASFSCSKCRLPISLAPELADPSTTSFNLLQQATPTPRPQSGARAYPPSRNQFLQESIAESTLMLRGGDHTNEASSRVRRYGSPGIPIITQNALQPLAPAVTTISNPAESFVLLEDGSADSAHLRDSVDDPHRLSRKLQQTRTLFELLSTRSEVDFPLCGECTELVIVGMNKEMAQLAHERDCYSSCLRKTRESTPSEADCAKATQTLATLTKEQEMALAELKAAEREHAEVLAELAQLQRESAQLDEEEAQFWLHRNQKLAELAQAQNEQESVHVRYEHDARQLEKLQRTNVYNDVFCIGHDGHFGTINGLRLGRLPGHPVDWTEINAAWGLTLLLLQTMASKLEFEFRGYRLHPMGSTSTIEKIEPAGGNLLGSASSGSGVTKSTVLELFGSTEVNPLRYFHRGSFDRAMVAFLECLRQLCEFVETQDASLESPYKIEKDKIRDACIRTAFNHDEDWTKALKLCLTNCKWILAAVAKLKRT
ncbi:autophagy protein Apg6-domain-containing protein [Protomyces lactucae-debilis]|uniref:Autophagy protein Apg6-domain-containing protein n=1 Tax=Protomyces lactucae-debilis TaxID=2754530 RepID=A0A1Y2F8W6_PROLT|nr:autophagy protein Apg6-domain-containing protein [Protomyces lactucae-debilis]ORY80329.1 autophagy protein Apg6-domain-containing protein [Protomyces lactucae-debilis]